jgi:glycosyltransferase involved in cell wall biosynthesis
MADLKRRPLNLNKKLYQLLAVWEAERLHRAYRFDMIWAMIAHSVAIPAGIFKKRHPDVKYLLTLQEGDPPEYIERLMKPVWPLFAQGFTSADALQPISNFLLAWGERMGFKGEARVIPNAVDTEKFGATFAPEAIAAMKETLGKEEGDVFLVTTSRLVHKNAVDDVIRALPLLPENISFLIYGVGPDEAMLRALAKELGVEERARFMGQIAHAEMPLMLASCDIFIRPSRSEGMGNSFLEAMAAGLPVIATQEGGIADFLFDAERDPGEQPTGWAVDADSPEQIAQAVTRIRNAPEEMRATIANARAMAFAKYDWNTIAQDMKALFDSLLKAPSDTA